MSGIRRKNLFRLEQRSRRREAFGPYAAVMAVIARVMDIPARYHEFTGK